jgi:hypothetical protein
VTVAALPGLLAVPLVFLWSPRSYELDAAEIRIIRVVGVARVPLEEIREVREIDDGLRLRRDFGSGGLFGFFGAFSEPALGKVTMYGSRNTHRVAVVTVAGTVLLTPDTPVAFVDAVKRACRT